MSGLLIAFEGLDGAGKSTQVRLFTRWLAKLGRKHRVLSLYDNATLIGQFALLNRRALISARDASLMTAADLAGRTETLVAPLLAAGHTVVWDKYVAGSLARDRARRLDHELLSALYEPLPRPAVTVFVDVDPDLACRRRRKEGGPLLWESGLDVFLGSPILEIERLLRSGTLPDDDLDQYFEAFQDRIRAEYPAVLDDRTVARVDGSGSVEEVAASIRRALASTLSPQPHAERP
jgi:thymidylate kinase